MSIYTRDTARTTLDKLESKFLRIENERAATGAATARYEVAGNMLGASAENSLAVAGRIMDADVAEETSRALRASILNQVTASLLAQSNQEAGIALQLLRG